MRALPHARAKGRTGARTMLDEFLSSNRETIIARARERLASRVHPKPSDADERRRLSRRPAHVARFRLCGRQENLEIHADLLLPRLVEPRTVRLRDAKVLDERAPRGNLFSDNSNP
jgi:hypothetical protein